MKKLINELNNEKIQREQYNVEKVVYGHLHGKESFKMGLKGEQNGVDYILASCDYTNFKLVKIMD